MPNHLLETLHWYTKSPSRHHYPSPIYRLITEAAGSQKSSFNSGQTVLRGEDSEVWALGWILKIRELFLDKRVEANLPFINNFIKRMKEDRLA